MSFGTKMIENRKKRGFTQEEDSMPEIEEILKNTTVETANQTNWTDVWSKKYPILKRYQEEMDVSKYRQEIRNLLEEIKMKYQYSELDTMLVLKDILYHEWKDSKR